MRIPCKNIPFYNHDEKKWSTMSFPDQAYFGKFLQDECFREPSEYGFKKESWKVLTVLGELWTQTKSYTQLPDNSKVWHEFWDKEETKCRLGVIWKHNGVYRYMTRDYYFFLNFCPIINKEKGQEESMASFRDVQYHMMLYEKIAECYHLHSAELKRRQMLYSFCHVAKSLNFVWFENKKTIKWFASDESFIDDVNGSWKFLNAYVNHLKKYTAWDKVLSPESYPEIQQKEKIKVQGRWLTDGNESTLVAKSLKKDPKKGVGGPAYWVWHEEGGIAPRADVTLQYLNSNLESGAVEKVGSFCIGGSVGDLKECKPLEEFIKDPTTYEMFAVPTKWYDESGIVKMCGLFIPAQYGMPQATDEDGNSMLELAMKLLDEAEEGWKKLPEPLYILRKSQNPRTIKEAFAYRAISRFPIRRIEKRQDQIKNDPALQPQRVELYEDEKGEVKWKATDKEDIGYPIDPKQVDKSGVVLMHEPPDKRFKHYAGVDNVEVGITQTSDSVFSIYIVRGVSEIQYEDEDNKRLMRQEGIKLVASWTGRLDTPDQTNDYAIMLMKLYNAWTLCERNKPNFISRCQQKGIATKYLMKEKEVPFNKEMDFGKDYTHDDYGLYMDSTGKKQTKCDDFVIEYLNEELDCVYKKDDKGNYTSEKLKIFYGIDRINDIWLLEECKVTGQPDKNTDRENAFRLAIVAAKTYELQGIKSKVLETKKPVKTKKLIREVSFLGTSNRLLTKTTTNKRNRGISFLG